MLQNIILPSISIIVGCVYSKWLFTRNGNSFFNDKDDLFSKVQSVKGWFAVLILIVVGILFLVKGIFQFTSI